MPSRRECKKQAEEASMREYIQGLCGAWSDGIDDLKHRKDKRQEDQPKYLKYTTVDDDGNKVKNKIVDQEKVPIICTNNEVLLQRSIRYYERNGIDKEKTLAAINEREESTRGNKRDAKKTKANNDAEYQRKVNKRKKARELYEKKKNEERNSKGSQVDFTNVYNLERFDELGNPNPKGGFDEDGRPLPGYGAYGYPIPGTWGFSATGQPLDPIGRPLPGYDISGNPITGYFGYDDIGRPINPYNQVAKTCIEHWSYCKCKKSHIPQRERRCCMSELTGTCYLRPATCTCQKKKIFRACHLEGINADEATLEEDERKKKVRPHSGCRCTSDCRAPMCERRRHPKRELSVEDVLEADRAANEAQLEEELIEKHLAEMEELGIKECYECLCERPETPMGSSADDPDTSDLSWSEDSSDRLSPGSRQPPSRRDVPPSRRDVPPPRRDVPPCPEKVSKCPLPKLPEPPKCPKPPKCPPCPRPILRPASSCESVPNTCRRAKKGKRKKCPKKGEIGLRLRADVIGTQNALISRVDIDYPKRTYVPRKAYILNNAYDTGSTFKPADLQPANNYTPWK